MTNSDIIGLISSYVYATTLLIGAEIAHRRFGLPQYISRKVVHIGAGMWVFGVLALFDTWYIGIVPFASFIVLNYVIYRFRLVQAVDSERSSPGTVYFAAAITLLFALFWRSATGTGTTLAAAACMALTWGDALAALVGERYGRHRLPMGNRTWEGSLAMLIVSFAAVLLTLLLFPGSPLGPQATPWPIGRAALAALDAALLATVAEAVAPAGTDNLAVPLAAALALLPFAP